MTSDPPTAPLPSSATGAPRVFFLLAAAVILGAVAASAWMPILAPRLPTDMARTNFILQSLKEPSPSPSICVFGHSVVMAGVDGRQISESLPGNPVVWNLGSGGQLLYESFLLYQELPDSVQVIVQCLDTSSFEHEPEFSPNKYHAFHMFGYRPETPTREATRRYASHDVWQSMQQSDFRHRFEARWMVRSAVDTGLRRVVRPELDFRRLERDLVFPGPWNNDRKVSPEVLQHLLDIHVKLRPRTGHDLNRRTTDFLILANQMCHARGIRLVLIILPQRPEFRACFGENYCRQLNALRVYLRQQHGLPLVDCHNLIAEDLFLDHCHFNQTGTQIFSDFIASLLKTL